MNEFLERAIELRDELVNDRRTIHRFGGVGFDVKDTSDYIFNRLCEMGLSPKRLCETGVVCTIGEGDRTFLLRSDIDALPFREETGLPYACTNGTHHACGHDMHAAMLLCAAKMLSERSDRLAGRVKLMFQPAEETLSGCRAMIEEGVLEDPKVDAAMSIHITVGHEDMPTGGIRYNRGVGWGSCDTFKITIEGQGGHGAYPFRSIDPINVASRLVTAFQELIASETPHQASTVVTVCKFESGTASNVIPDKAVLEGTVRSLSPEYRAFVKKRMEELTTGIASAYRCKGIVDFTKEVGMCISDDSMLDMFIPVLEDIAGDKGVLPGTAINGSEDFAGVMERVPSVLLWLGAGRPSEGYKVGIHKPTMTVNEDVMPIGAAMHASCASLWLERNRR